MDPSAIVALLKEGGGWGVAALAILWAIYERLKHVECQSERVKDAQSLTIVLTEAKLAIVGVMAALESRKGYFERLGDQVEERARETLQELRLIRQSLEDERRWSGRP